MKTKTTITAAITALTFALVSCDKKSDVAHDHDGDGKPDHGPEAHGTPVPHDHDGDGVPDHGPGAHHDHDHPPIEAGPNGGKILTAPDFRSEFFVTADRKVQITFLDDQNKTTPLQAQEVSLTGGDRSNPTNLTFSKSDDGMSLISTATLPEGDKLPVILTVKLTPDAEEARARMMIDLTHCDGCNRKEYACTCCDHDH